jgi:outer membrane protein TolC
LINSFGWQTNTSNVDGLKNYNDAFTNSLNLQISQPVFTYNRRKMALKQLELNLENANISYALQRLNTERQITGQFYAVYTAQSNVEISKEELVNVQASYEIIKNKVEADLAVKDELYQAELNLATARSSVDANVVQLENAKDQLKQTLGLPLEQDLEVVAEVNIKPVDVDLNMAIEHGLSSRLELRQREIAGEELEFELIRTKALNEFRGDISLSLGLTGDNSNFGKIYDTPVQNPRVAITFAIPIFDWGEKKARIKAQKMSQEVHDIDKEEDKKNIELNIRQVWRSLDNLRTQIAIVEQSVRNAQLAYELNLTRYREGDITGMQINQFQTQLSSKKMEYAQALINYKLELLNLKILSLFDFEKNMPIL